MIHGFLVKTVHNTHHQANRLDLSNNELKFQALLNTFI